MDPVESYIFHSTKILQHSCKGYGVVVRASVNSISSHSFEARGLKIGTQTPHLNATKLLEGIFEILSRRRVTGP